MYENNGKNLGQYSNKKVKAMLKKEHQNSYIGKISTNKQQNSKDIWKHLFQLLLVHPKLLTSTLHSM